MIIVPRLVLVTLDLTYYRLDFPLIVQQFVWQTEDERPRFPRIQQFLGHWRENVGARLAQVQVAYADDRVGQWRRVERVSEWL